MALAIASTTSNEVRCPMLHEPNFFTPRIDVILDCKPRIANARDVVVGNRNFHPIVSYFVWKIHTDRFDVHLSMLLYFNLNFDKLKTREYSDILSSVLIEVVAMTYQPHFSITNPQHNYSYLK